MVEKFVCKQCGNCCKAFGSQQNKDIEVPRFFDGINFLIVLSQPNLLLFDWEKNLFPEELITPYHVCYDLKNERTIILNYTLKSNCPFLNKDKKCSIYEKRPVSCREFPCPYSALDTSEFRGGRLVDHSKICVGEKNVKELHNILGFDMDSLMKNIIKFDPLLFKKNLYQRYGRACTYRIAITNVNSVIITFLNEMLKSGKISLAKSGYNLKFLVRRIDNSKKIDISKLFLEYNKEEPQKFFSENSLVHLEKNFQ